MLGEVKVYTADNYQTKPFVNHQDVLNSLDMIKKNLDANDDIPKRKIEIPVLRNKEPKDFYTELIPVACLKLGFIAGDCQNAIMFLINESKRKEVDAFGDVIFPQLIENVLSTKKQIQIIKVAGKLAHQHIANFIKNQALPEYDFYTSLVNEFKRIGNSHSTAQENALYVMAIYSLRGGQWYDGLIDWLDSEVTGTTSKQAAQSISIVVSALNFFNKITFWKKGLQYALPQSHIKTQCFYGKPYHFWLASFLSYHSNTAGEFKSSYSLAASHMLLVGYEIARVQGDGYNRINLSTLFNPSSNAARLDLVFGTAGAWFGLKFKTPLEKGLDIDVALLRNFNKASNFGSEKLPHMQFYSVLAPDSHYSYFSSNL